VSSQDSTLSRYGASARAAPYPLFYPPPPPVDQVAVEERAASLGKRSLKKGAKVAGLKLAIRMMDLTTLEGKDTPGKVRQMCRKAISPLDSDGSIGPCAAVCVYPNLVATAKSALAGSGVKVASVATAFPSGQSPLDVKLADVRRAVELGADEIDMVIDRGAFLAGDYAKVLDEVVAVKAACGAAHLKVILETGELVTLDNVRRASWIAMLGGADFIKTSTGKVSPASTLPVALVMLEAVREFAEFGGATIGVKVAGGIRTTKDAIGYLVLVNETAGPEWLDPTRFRIGASGLLNDLLMQRAKQRSGIYASPADVSLE
jgi:deoxyribose-phosphate aldolase